MENLSTITTFFGWLTIVNFGLYTATSIALIVFGKSVKTVHSKLTNVPIEKLDVLYFSYLGNFKIAIMIFSLAPYIVLKIMGN